MITSQNREIADPPATAVWAAARRSGLRTGLSLNLRAHPGNPSCRSSNAQPTATQRAEISMQSPNDRFRSKTAPDSVEAAEDAACLAAVVRGDREAFERLY